jgi:hypothetical protein
VLALLALAALPAVAKRKPKGVVATPTASLPPILLNLLLSTNAEPDRGPAPLKVELETEVYEGDDAVKPQYEWDFGDGTAKSRAQKPTHIYKKPGDYKVVVRVKDATGRTGSSELDIEVESEE